MAHTSLEPTALDALSCAYDLLLDLNAHHLDDEGSVATMRKIEAVLGIDQDDETATLKDISA